MKQTSGKTAGLLAMAAVVIIYGVSYLSREVVGGYLSTISILAIQMGLMTLLFTLINVFGKKSFRVARRDIPWIIASGLFGTTFFHGFTILSVNSIGATVSSLLFGFAAAFALIIEILFFHRKVTKLGIASILISLVGIYILMGIKFTDLMDTDFMGYVLCLGSVISWGIYTFLSDKITGDYERTVILNYQAIVGLCTTAPFMLMTGLDVSALASPTVIMNLVVLGIFNSTVAYFLNLYAIRKIGVTLSNLMLNFLPVVTVALSAILYGTLPTVGQIVGGILILISVFLLDKDQRQVEAAKS